MNKKKNLEMFACIRGAATCIDICIKSASLSPPWALTPKLRKSEYLVSLGKIVSVCRVFFHKRECVLIDVRDRYRELTGTGTHTHRKLTGLSK